MVSAVLGLEKRSVGGYRLVFLFGQRLGLHASWTEGVRLCRRPVTRYTAVGQHAWIVGNMGGGGDRRMQVV